MLIKVPIEVDITYTNKTWFSHRKTNNEKHYVIGFFRRVKEKARIVALENNNPETIHAAIIENIEAGCDLYVEENLLPQSIKELYNAIELKALDGHAKGDLHVNNVKNMWRDLKRSIKMEHHSVSKKHLQGYCDTVTWHINTRHLTPSEKFELALGNVSHRLRYQDLINR